MALAHPALVTGLLCVAFVTIGGSVAVLGPSLPGLAQAIGRPLPDLGALLSALFAGMLVGQVGAGLLVDRIGVRLPMIGSFALFALGVSAIPLVSTLAWLLVSGLVMGLGFGAASISVNTQASRLMPRRPGFVLNLGNVFYACGSVAGPFAASLLLARGGRAVAVLFAAGVVMALLLPAAAWLLPTRAVVAPAAAAGPTIPAAPPRRWRPSASLVCIGVVVMLYGGVEAGFGGWAASYVQLTLRETPARGALLTSLFWFAYLIGRIVATVAALRISPGIVLTATAATITLGGVMLGLGFAHETRTVVAIALLGLGTGPLYPAMFALVTTREAYRPATAVSVASSIGSIGAVVFPWLMGQALPVADGRIVSWMPAGFGVGILAALWASDRFSRAAAATSRHPA